MINLAIPKNRGITAINATSVPTEKCKNRYRPRETAVSLIPWYNLLSDLSGLSSHDASNSAGTSLPELMNFSITAYDAYSRVLLR